MESINKLLCFYGFSENAIKYYFIRKYIDNPDLDNILNNVRKYTNFEYNEIAGYISKATDVMVEMCTYQSIFKGINATLRCMFSNIPKMKSVNKQANIEIIEAFNKLKTEIPIENIRKALESFSVDNWFVPKFMETI